MATLQDVHVLELDRATGKMECTRINPTRHFALRGDTGFALYTWQNGHWFGLGGNELQADIVPLEFRDAIQTNLPTVESRGPSVIVTCEFCGQQMNRSERDTHLVTHVKAALEAAGKPPAAAAEPAKDGKEPFVRQARAAS